MAATLLKVGKRTDICNTLHHMRTSDVFGVGGSPWSNQSINRRTLRPGPASSNCLSLFVAPQCSAHCGALARTGEGDYLFGVSGHGHVGTVVRPHGQKKGIGSTIFLFVPGISRPTVWFAGIQQCLLLE